uniref:Secreted protein n=1 Tax=Trypanosoma vivax (strain Y486) TaxID=1055687 RepID=G0U1U1_TRYVY|nr:hypothetical protein TVY486_0900630 [Trypanosoma vivax Y486]
MCMSVCVCVCSFLLLFWGVRVSHQGDRMWNISALLQFRMVVASNRHEWGACMDSIKSNSAGARCKKKEKKDSLPCHVLYQIARPPCRLACFPSLPLYHGTAPLTSQALLARTRTKNK